MILSLFNIIIFFGLAIFAYFSWRKIEYGIYAIVFFLPLYLARLSIFGIPSTVLELAIYVLFIIWLVKSYFFLFVVNTPSNSPYKGEEKNNSFCKKGDKNNSLYKGEDKKETPPLLGEVRWCIFWQGLSLSKKERFIFLGILLLLTGAVISTVFSSDIRTGAGILKGWFLDPVLFFIILVSELKTFEQKKSVLKSLFFSGAIVAMVSLLYQFGILSGGISYDNRLYSIYLSPNYLAMYLSPALIIGFWLFLKLYCDCAFFSVIPSPVIGARNPLDIKNNKIKRFLPACWQVEMTKYLKFLFQKDNFFT